MDGFKVLDELKKSNELRGTPVVALTARSMKGDRENLLAHGFDGYISKPVDHDTFEKSVWEYLNRTEM
jgi:CheY-like chemotaxis protein